ncbi:MAG: BamA/TamA family outer membrane protein [Chitinophagaceae bacterium]
MKQCLLLGLLLLNQAFRNSAIAQTGEKKRFQAFPFPVVYYSPETRLAGGLAGTATFRFKADSLNIRPSSATLGAAYTQNKQILTYVNFSIFYDNAKWYAFGEAGYYKYSYKFFGIGVNEMPEVLYSVNYPRIKLNLDRKLFPKLYVGFTSQFEDYAIKDTAKSGPLANDEIPGNRGSRSVGLGPQLIFDSRDSVLFPSKGWYAIASWITNGAVLGGDHSFNRYVLDVAHYIPLHPKIILALNSFNSFVTGDAPFEQQSLMGGNKQMRGYYEGRYIDKNMAVLQAEMRFPIWWRFGGVVFGDVAALGNEPKFLRLNDSKYSFGAGLRFNIVRKDHLNLRLDYALVQGSSGIYFTVGEAF